MAHRKSTALLVLTLCFAAVPSGAGRAQDLRVVPVTGQAEDRLTLDRLYSLPRIIGTAPTAVAWSPSSTQVAFLWNDEGANFRDVWVADVEGGVPQRVTRFPRPAFTEAGTDIDAIRRNQHAELDGGVAAVAWYPDGEHLLVTFRGEFHRVAIGSETEALGLRGRQAGFSTDGHFLSFLGQGDVWLAPLADGKLGPAARLTTFAGEASGVVRHIWSPDGHSVAVILRDSSTVATVVIPDYLGEATTVNEVPRPFPGGEPGRLRLSVVDIEPRATRAMDLGEDDRDRISSLAWSADSKRLLVDKSDLYAKDRRLLSIDAVTGEATLLYREREPSNVTAGWSAVWAPDGGVYFTSDRDDFYHLYHLAEAGAEPVAVTRGDWSVERFEVTDNGLFVVTNRQHPAQRHIYRVPLTGGEPQRLSENVGTHTPTYSPDGRWAAVLFSSDSQPPDLFLNRLDAAGETRVTSSPLPEFAAHDWVTPEYVTFASHVDGVTLHGRLMLPSGFDPRRRYPAIIGSIYSNTLRNQWGGRSAHPVWGVDQYLLQQGYVLLNINIRGSWGHGRAFRRKLRLDYGGIDTEDIYSGVQYLDSLGYVDMKRVGLWGSSYGGLMTAMSLFKRPGVFAAGVAGAPATNVWHALTGEMMVMGRPQDQPEAYAASSAFTHAAGLQDPLMIIHGMRDRIVLFKDSLQLLENLMLLGKAHLLELVVLPNSPHGWDTRELYQTRYAFKRLVSHFDRYLKPSE